MFTTRKNHLSTKLFKLLQQGIEEPEIENRIDYYRPWFRLVNEFIRLESIECKSPTKWALEIISQRGDNSVFTVKYNHTQIIELVECYDGKFIGGIWVPEKGLNVMFDVKAISSMKLITLKKI